MWYRPLILSVHSGQFVAMMSGLWQGKQPCTPCQEAVRSWGCQLFYGWHHHSLRSSAVGLNWMCRDESYRLIATARQKNVCPMSELFVLLQVATWRTALTVWVVLPAVLCIYNFWHPGMGQLWFPRHEYLYQAPAVLQLSTPAYAFGPWLMWSAVVERLVYKNVYGSQSVFASWGRRQGSPSVANLMKQQVWFFSR